MPGLACLILLQEEGSLAAGKVALQLAGFLPFFAIYGALGFYFLVLRRTSGLPMETEAFAAAAHRASRVGFAGSGEGLVAEMVSRFSNLALGAAALLGVTGVITAWRHLKFVAALWTTPYGWAFDVKLCLVLIVAAIGGWNCRRMRPRLGAEGAARELQRSATRELLFAGLVLVVTAVLVSLPTPELPP